MRSLILKSIAIIMFLFTFHIVSAVEGNLIDEIEGVYIAPGKAIYQRCSDCAWIPVKNATDCLVIKKLTNQTASVYMSTIQNRGYSCTIEEDYIFKIHGENELYFQDAEMVLEKKTDGVYVIRDGERIKFNVQPRRLETMYMGCGSAATIGNVSFKLSSKRVPWKRYNETTNTQTPFNLFQYCPAWNKP